MGFMDEFKAERDALKQKTPKQKLQHFFDYYRNYAIIGLVVIGILISVVVRKINEKEVLLTCILLNNQMTSEAAATELEEGFLAELQKDSKKSEIMLMTNWNYIIDTEPGIEENYNTVQGLMAHTTGGSLDVVVGDLDSMTLLAYGAFYEDISTILTEEQMEIYEPYFLYMDLAVLEKIKEAVDTENYDVEIVSPDATKPEEMEKPVPVFIDVSRCEKLSAVYPNTEKSIVLAIAVNASRAETISEWVDFLME